MKLVRADSYDLITQDVDLVAYLRVINREKISVKFVGSPFNNDMAMAILCKSRVEVEAFKEQVSMFQFGMIEIQNFAEFIEEIEFVKNDFNSAKILYAHRN